MREALIIIDVQNDFCPGGALEVSGGNEIVHSINELSLTFDTIVLTQDWHPSGHSSFASSHDGKDPFSHTELSYGTQVLWPDHCIQGSVGAQFHSDLKTDRASLILRKGMNPHIDSYSAFFENDRETPTGLKGWLDSLGISKLVMVGLAYDYCVSYSAIDGAGLGFEVEVIRSLTRAIDLNHSARSATDTMQAAGVTIR